MAVTLSTTARMLVAGTAATPVTFTETVVAGDRGGVVVLVRVSSSRLGATAMKPGEPALVAAVAGPGSLAAPASLDGPAAKPAPASINPLANAASTLRRGLRTVIAGHHRCRAGVIVAERPVPDPFGCPPFGSERP